MFLLLFPEPTVVLIVVPEPTVVLIVVQRLYCCSVVVVNAQKNIVQPLTFGYPTVHDGVERLVARLVLDRAADAETLLRVRIREWIKSI